MYVTVSYLWYLWYASKLHSKLTEMQPVIWGMISVSSLFLLLRFCTRWRTFGRFFADDVFALLAWLCAATMGVLAVHMASAMYYIIERSMSSASASVGPEILTTVRGPIFFSVALSLTRGPWVL